MAEGTQGSLKVGSEATVTAYKMPDAPHMATYSAQFISTTSKSIPFTGNFETKLALTADSGVELEYEQTETVITEAPYESRTWQVATKGNDGRLYGVSPLVTEIKYKVCNDHGCDDKLPDPHVL